MRKNEKINCKYFTRLKIQMLRSGKTWWTIVLTGLFTGLVLFTVYFLLLLLNRQIISWIFVLVYIIPSLGMIYASIRIKYKYLNGYINFSETFLVSLLTGLFSAGVYAALLYLVFTQLNSSELKYRAIHLEQYLQAQTGNVSLHEIKAMRYNINQLLSASSLALFNLIFHSLLAVIYAFIIAIFVRRKNRFIEA
ncbi:MAG: DUF4199 domain-containing protein [Bacteroidales bacterium]|jgi:hypothetical protein|nr:DUF4199 domain-containing protein [Bacteroidales bacterium]